MEHIKVACALKVLRKGGTDKDDNANGGHVGTNILKDTKHANYLRDITVCRNQDFVLRNTRSRTAPEVIVVLM